MDKADLQDLKGWRERFGITRKRLSELTSISPITLRQLEDNAQKPQMRTIRKLSEIMAAIEADPEKMLATDDENKPKRGRKPKLTGFEKRTDFMDMREGSFPIRLTNLDLELINRILNLTGMEKIDLLRTLL